MSSESQLRIAMMTMLVVTAAVGAYHRFQAAKSGERISRKDEGRLFAVSLRLAGLSLWLGTFAYLVDPRWMAWAQLPLPIWMRWLGTVFGVLGCGLMYWTLTNLGKNLTDTVMVRAHATLVTTGPYRWVRHPFYVTVALLTPAATLLAANWFIGLSALAVLAMLVARTSKEEQQLIERFGDPYRSYMATTGRFWPSMRIRQH
jgi:protein-S-isoprenylcysteine O-methyltransferase Ste14